jgi:hypothetical protein
MNVSHAVLMWVLALAVVGVFGAGLLARREARTRTGSSAVGGS